MDRGPFLVTLVCPGAAASNASEDPSLVAVSQFTNFMGNNSPSLSKGPFNNEASSPAAEMEARIAAAGEAATSLPDSAEAKILQDPSIGEEYPLSRESESNPKDREPEALQFFSRVLECSISIRPG